MDPESKNPRYHQGQRQVGVAVARLKADTPRTLVLHVQNSRPSFIQTVVTIQHQKG